MNGSNGSLVTLAMAAPEDMDAIFRMRHRVYAAELGQHEENAEGRLRDSLDAFNAYIVAKVGGDLAGFISVTPPGGPSYSVDENPVKRAFAALKVAVVQPTEFV